MFLVGRGHALREGPRAHKEKWRQIVEKQRAGNNGDNGDNGDNDNNGDKRPSRTAF